METSVAAAAKAVPESSMPAETTANRMTAAAEPAAESSEPEVVAMTTDTAEPVAGAEAGKSKWKFWQWRPAKTEPATTATAATTMDTVTATAETEAEVGMPAGPATNLVTEAAESIPESSETEVVAMTTDTAEPAGRGRGQSKWKFWQWRPAKAKPATTMDTMTAAAEAEPEAGQAEVAAMETVAAQPAPAPVARKAKAVAMAPTPSAPQDMSAVYMQTGAFRLRENAERLRPSVEALAPGAFKVIQTSGARTLYKIEIGPLAGTAEALRVRRELKAVGINPKIVDSPAGDSMMASAQTYRAQPLRSVEKPAAPVEKPATPARETVAAKPVEYKYATPEPAKPSKRPAVSAAAKPMEQVRATIPVARPEPAPAPVRRGKKSLYQQAGAFARSNNATRLRTKIVDKTHEPTEIVQEPTELPARGLVNLHKVQVGPLQNKTEAMEVKRALIPLGVTDSFPVYREKK